MNCIICNDSSVTSRFVLGRHEVGKCDCCGTMINLTYYKDSSFRDGMFEREYYDHTQKNAFSNRLNAYHDDPSVRVYQRYLRIIEEHLSHKGKVLDVGCAFGTFLRVAADFGWESHGVELSEFSSETARRNWGFPIHTGDLSSYDGQKESFDLITFWDVIEHVPNPVENLRKAYSLLKPGGMLLITTDNYKSLFSGVAKAVYGMTAGKVTYAMDKFFIPWNTFYFQPKTLHRILQDVGFSNVYSEKMDYPIEKLDLKGLEKLVVKSFYVAGELLNMNSQFMVIERKNYPQ